MPTASRSTAAFATELLDREIFTSLLEARTLIEQHRCDYNDRRPHSSLGYKTPKQFAREHQAMEAAGLWKAAEKARLPTGLGKRPPSTARVSHISHSLCY